MTSKPIYVTRPNMPPLVEFIPYLETIWASGVVTNGGDYHRELESALSAHLGVSHISLFTNATIALITAIRALRITGEVITTPYTFVATAHSLVWNGIQPVFVDIDADTLNLDPLKIEAAITPKTTAIMPVHCYGNACDVSAIQDIAHQHHLKVLYDAAHAFGVLLNNQSVLNYGDMSVLSFHATKVFHTFEGGAIVCHDIETKHQIDCLKNFGYIDDTTVLDKGINGKMSEFNAAFGLLQLKHIDQAIIDRGVIDRQYRELLGAIHGIRCLPQPADLVPNYAYFPILLEESYPASRNELYERMHSGQVFARRYFYPLISEFPVYRSLPSAHPDNLRVAKDSAERVICLPIYSGMTGDDVERVVSLIRPSA